MPAPARALRTAFALLYWAFVVLLVGSLGVSVIGRQVWLVSPPEGVTAESDPARCRALVDALAADLDADGEAALARNREHGDGLLAFRRTAKAWEARWRHVRHGCGLAEPEPRNAAQAALADAHDALLDHRFGLESFVKRHADREGPARGRIDELLARARKLGGAE